MKPVKAAPTLPHMVRAVPNLPVTHNLPDSMATSFPCAMCKTWGGPWPMLNQQAPPISPPHPDWFDLEEKEEDWNEERAMNREHEEKDL